MRAEREPAGRRERTDASAVPAGYVWPEALVFVGDDCSLYRPVAGTGNRYDSLSVTVFNPRDSRAFPEHDLPSPMKVGHKLFALKPAKPGVAPQPLLDAGSGAIGSLSASFDGRWIYHSMAPAGEAFYHIYKINAEGGAQPRMHGGTTAPPAGGRRRRGRATRRALAVHPARAACQQG